MSPFERLLLPLPENPADLIARQRARYGPDDYDTTIRMLNAQKARGVEFPEVHRKAIEWNRGLARSPLCDTEEEAEIMAWKAVLRTGWTQPRWWEFWRWSEKNRRIPESVRAVLSEDQEGEDDAGAA